MSFIYVPSSGGGPPVTFPIEPNQGGTGNSVPFSAGAIPFADSSGVYQEDSNFGYFGGTLIVPDIDLFSGTIFGGSAGFTNYLLDTGFADGEVLFANGGAIASDDQFLFDPTNNILAVGVPVTTGINASLELASGVQFPAVQVSSSNANVLDDYEEGTFTPSIAPTTGSVTTSFAGGNYTKIGNVVYFIIGIILSGITAPTGTLRINGLPFAPGGTTATVTVYLNNFAATAITAIMGLVSFSGTSLTITRYATGANANMAADLQANSIIRINGFYLV